jgi:hypothetical protein
MALTYWLNSVFALIRSIFKLRLLILCIIVCLEITRLRGRRRNRWQNEVREDGRIVDGEGWQEKVNNREEWRKLLRTARNLHILHMPRE